MSRLAQQFSDLRLYKKDAESPTNSKFSPIASNAKVVPSYVASLIILAVLLCMTGMCRWQLHSFLRF